MYVEVKVGVDMGALEADVPCVRFRDEGGRRATRCAEEHFCPSALEKQDPIVTHNTRCSLPVAIFANRHDARAY
jgi:hypothetical protein